jgi:ABC-type microcin C transport system duplicated ATPase subunit YejF
MSILRLLPQPSAKIVEGSVLYCADASPIDLAKLPLADLQKVRGSEISCIFQEPMQALNPVVTIRKQLMEVFKFSSAASSKVTKESFLATVR